MLQVHVSYWAVVIYGDPEVQSRALLKKIQDKATEEKIQNGSVGVCQEPSKDALVHLDLLSCDRERAERLIVSAGVSLSEVRFECEEDTPVENDPGHRSSCRNRKARLCGV